MRPPWSTKPPGRRPRAVPEDIEQASLMEWAALAEATHPELERLFHIPNGGQRHKVVAAKLVGQGVRPGVPDLCLPVPRGGWHGLWIEMKSATGRTSPEQREWLEFLALQGYATAVCRGWFAARDVLLAYLEGRFKG